MKTQANLQAYQAARKAWRQAREACAPLRVAYYDALSSGATQVALSGLYYAACAAIDEVQRLRYPAALARAAYYAKPPCISVEWPTDGVNPVGAAQHLSMTRQQLGRE